MEGRFYVKESGKSPLLIGVSVGELLNVGHVYEITKCMGVIQLKDLGKSAILGDNADIGSVDRLLAIGGGRHCIVEEQPAKTVQA